MVSWPAPAFWPKVSAREYNILMERYRIVESVGLYYVTFSVIEWVRIHWWHCGKLSRTVWISASRRSTSGWMPMWSCPRILMPFCLMLNSILSDWNIPWTMFANSRGGNCYYAAVHLPKSFTAEFSARLTSPWPSRALWRRYSAREYNILMERYRIVEGVGLYYVTFSVVECAGVHWWYCWQIITDSLNFCIQKKHLGVNAYVIMPTHLHAILFDVEFNPKWLKHTLDDVRKFTGRQLLDHAAVHCAKVIYSRIRKPCW